MEEVTASTGCGNVLVVMGSAAEEVAEFIVLSAEPVGRAMLLEAAHTSDPSLDPTMVLFKSIVQIDARPVTDVAAQRRADRAWVGIMPVGCHAVRHKAGNRPCGAEELLGCSHVTGRAQHRVDEVPVAIDRPIQVAPAAMNLEVGFVDVPTLARAASCAVTPLAQRLTDHRQQLRLPLPDALVAHGEPAQEQDLAEIPQCQPVAQPAEHHERYDVARQRRSIADTVAALVELLAAVPAAEPTIALCCQVWPLGHRR
jgi:hypothetical protein